MLPREPATAASSDVADKPVGLTGILLIDKEGGWTSHDVVAKARRLTGQRRIGHTGTLDPAATGLLVLCLGNATRLVEYMVGHDKRYEGEIFLGVTTATDDAEGTEVERRPVPAVDEGRMRELEAAFTGQLQQRPPNYSAVQVGGERAYSAARRGKPLALAPRAVEVHRIGLWPITGERLGLRLHCGPGTYVRSLARDIGERLGCGAHLGSLRRLSVGRFEVGLASSLDDLAEAVTAGRLDELLLAADEGMLDRAAAVLAVGRARQLANGTVLDVERCDDGNENGAIRVYDSDGGFVGVGRLDAAQRLRAEKIFRAEIDA